MKKSLTIIVALLAGGLLVCSCGYGGGGLDGGMDGQDGNGGGDQAGNECEQAAEIRMQGIDEVCAPRSSMCCFCQCWFDGRKAFNVNEYFQNQNCVCEVPQPNPEPCEGSLLTDAQACLADQSTCRAEAQNMVTDAEEGMCTMTPL
jgi:hypothetical protein